MPEFGRLPPQVRRLFLKEGWKNCEWCGSWFKPVRTQQRFDHPRCRQASWKAQQ